MKIKLIKYTWRWKEEKQPEYFGESYHYLPLDFCCDELRNNKDDNIELTAEAENQVGDTYYFPTFAIAKEIESGSWGDTWVETVLTPIKFCPYCGKYFEFEIVNEEDKTEELKELFKQIDKLEKKFYRTNSIKTQNKLRDELDKLRSQAVSIETFGPYTTEDNKKNNTEEEVHEEPEEN